MAFRSPSPSSSAVASVRDTALTGTVNNNFMIPQDADSIVVKVWTGTTFTGTSPTADVYVQTTEDGGSTWRDVAHFKQITAAVGNQMAEFCPIACIGASPVARALANWIGSVPASTLAATTASGMPMMGVLGRISVVYGGTVGVNSSINVDVFAPTAELR